MIFDLLFLYLAAVNLAAFLAFALDKRKARRGGWRISEFTLLGFSAAGGAFGAFLAMKTFRHKTRHKKFTILVPLLIVAWLAVIVCLTGVKI